MPSFAAKAVLTACLLCAFAFTAKAQKGVVHFIDSLLMMRQAKAVARCDTAYIGLPDYRWTVKARLNGSGTTLFTNGTIEESPFKSTLDTEPRLTVGANVSYRGLGLGLTLNPARLAGRDKDFEINLASYGNRLGGEIVYTTANTFSGTAERYGTESELRPGLVSVSMIQGSAYYAFNHHRFSFPAAFSQSQIQKRSCGTWLIGLSAITGRITADADAVFGMGTARLSTFNMSIGCGYAYNFVFHRKWLLHVSAVPQIVVLSRNRLSVNEERLRSEFRFPKVSNVGRLAIVRNFGNRFIGFSAVVSFWSQGDRDELQVGFLKYRARFSYGFRF